MRALTTALILASGMLSLGQAWASTPTSIVLRIGPDCADVEAETQLVSELRLRLPEATVMLGNTEDLDGDWRIDWRSNDAGECLIDVRGRGAEPQSLDMPQQPEPGDIELAASQVAWLVSMARTETSVAEKPTAAGPAASTSEAADPDVSAVPALADALPDPPVEPKAPVDAAPVAEPPAKEDASPAAPEEAEPPANVEPSEPVEPAEKQGPEDVEPTPKPRPNESEGKQRHAEDWGPESRWVRVPVAVSTIPQVHFPGSSRGLVPTVSLNPIGGELWGLSGLEFGLAYNSEIQFMHGAQFAFGFNRVGNYVRGAQLAFGANFNRRETRGAQLAFGYNDGGRLMEGAQLAFGMNAAGDLRGVQGAFGFNLASQVDGVQTAFGLNTARDVRGVQLGAVNLADDVRGLQVGVVNISDSADAPIGLVNIVADEPVYVIGWMGLSGLVTVGVQHGGRYLRYLYLGAAKAVGDVRVFGAGFGISGHIPLESLYLDLDLIAMQLSSDDVTKQSFMATTRVIVGWELAERFALFVGPALNILNTGRDDALGLLPFGMDAPVPAAGSAATVVWPEVQFGMRF